MAIAAEPLRVSSRFFAGPSPVNEVPLFNMCFMFNVRATLAPPAPPVVAQRCRSGISLHWAEVDARHTGLRAGA